MTTIESILKTIFSSSAELEHKITGGNGCKVLEVGEHSSLNAYSFIVQEDAVISAFSVDGENALAAFGLSGYTLKAGAYISAAKRKSITSMTIASGSVIIYNL